MGAELTGTELLDDVVTWRRHLHAHPELGYEVEETAGFVADKLRTFGCDEVVTGVGRTGVVATIEPGLPIGRSRPQPVRLPPRRTASASRSKAKGRMEPIPISGSTLF